MEKFAIIVAGGTGTRMQSEVPKQFLLHDGVPIIIKTIRAFKEADPSIQLIIVLPEEHMGHWETLLPTYPVVSEVSTTFGGATRSASVLAGLSLVHDDGLVAVHDAVRPFVDSETILESFASAEKHGSGVASVALKDSIRELDAEGSSKAMDRASFVLVQTPQTFRVHELKQAYQSVGDQSFTDDASVYEASGRVVHLIEGSYSNIKITTPEDLK